VSEAQNKPVPIETRRDLLFAATKRRSVKSILVWCVLAFAIGVLSSFAVDGLVDIRKHDKDGDESNAGVVDSIRVSDSFV